MDLPWEKNQFGGVLAWINETKPQPRSALKQTPLARPRPHAHPALTIRGRQRPTDERIYPRRVDV